MKSPKAPISWGELVDKITILEIKLEKIDERSAIKNVNRELSLLQEIYTVCKTEHPEVGQLKSALRDINKTLWNIEDLIREKEAQKKFDSEFVDLARRVYQTNDQRAKLKRDINILVQSELIEEKSYSPY